MTCTGIVIVTGTAGRLWTLLPMGRRMGTGPRRWSGSSRSARLLEILAVVSK
ncbi:hypothetical protein ACFVY0_38015 [Streptomyces sp. NPDC058286]|uniref:hypothetical protein n=1 Tax=Streptomyces sp. NPDC058286 TaxID=3346422 RepID=UPI0036EB5E16